MEALECQENNSFMQKHLIGRNMIKEKNDGKEIKIRKHQDLCVSFVGEEELERKFSLKIFFSLHLLQAKG